MGLVDNAYSFALCLNGKIIFVLKQLRASAIFICVNLCVSVVNKGYAKGRPSVALKKRRHCDRLTGTMTPSFWKIKLYGWPPATHTMLSLVVILYTGSFTVYGL